MQNDQTIEIVRADTSARQRLTGAILLLAAIGAVEIYFAQRYVASLSSVPNERLLPQVGVLALAAAGALGFFSALAGAWIFALGVRTLKARRYPPPRMKVLRDTQVRWGWRARSRALLAIVLGMTLIGAGGALPFVAWRLTNSLTALAALERITVGPH